MAAGLGLFKLVATGVAVATVDRVGRRPLLIGGVATMSAALAVLAAAQKVATAAAQQVQPRRRQLLQAPSAAAASDRRHFFSPAGLLGRRRGPPHLRRRLPGLVRTDHVAAGRGDLPAAARGRAAALATLTNFGANAAVSLALPPLQASRGRRPPTRCSR